jgi:hypothetical protein
MNFMAKNQKYFPFFLKKERAGAWMIEACCKNRFPTLQSQSAWMN